MDTEEIIQYTKLSKNRMVTISIDRIAELPCYVRLISIYPNNVVWIRFRRIELDEGGISFRGQFDDLDILVHEMEKYLGKSIGNWHNHTKSGKYTQPIEECPDNLNWDYVRKVSYSYLPKSGNFRNPND